MLFRSVVGHLNILSVVFAPLLLGLGIDYGTHWLSRYQEELASNGLSRRDAIEKTMVKLGPGLIYAGFSAALSFFPLTLTGFKGLVELGIICSMGMLVTTTTSMCVLPAITLLFDRGARPKKASLSLQRPLFQFTGRRAMCILTVSCVLLAGSLFLASGISFDMNLLHLQSKSSESVIWEKKLLDDSKRSSMYGAILARSMEEVRSKARAVEVLATVSDVVSVETFLPQDQEDKLDVVRSMSALVPGSRQFSDDQIRALIARDAVIGVACDAWMLYPNWIPGTTTPESADVRIEHCADHIDHICQLSGDTRHCAIGSDLDGGYGREQCPRDLDSIADLQRLAGLLAQRGYSQAAVESILHGNWVRQLMKILS